MKNTCGFILVALFSLFLASCHFANRSEEKAVATAFRDINQMAEASSKFKVPPSEVLPYIQKVSEAMIQVTDPEGQFLPTKTAFEIYQGHIIATENDIPNPALDGILKATESNIQDISPIGWGAILGGLLLAIGAAGKFVGGPWNIAGMLVQTIGKSFVPDYNKYKKAAVGALASVDKVLDNYGCLLDLSPELKKSLSDKLGEDPVIWFKKQLKTTQTDLGTPEVSQILDTLKNEMTTKNGTLHTSSDEIGSFIKKMIS